MRSTSVSEAVEALQRRCGELRHDLRFLMRADDPDFVYFLERRGRGLFLRASPIDVSRVVREAVLDRFRSVVLTSATLAVDQSFDYVKGRLGIRKPTTCASPSEFDYATQALLYLPRRMPSPKAPGFAEAAAREVIEILRRSRGRAFVLFTSYAVLRTVQQFVEMALPYPILVQGTRPASDADRSVPEHAERRAARHIELLAGRGCRRRRPELRHHRQAAVCVARRPGDGGAHRCHPRVGRRCVRATIRFRWRSSAFSRDSGGSSGTAPTAACWRYSIRGSGRWDTGDDSWRRCRRHP